MPWTTTSRGWAVALGGGVNDLIKARLKGGGNVVRNLMRAEKNIPNAVARGVYTAAVDLTNTAKSNTPVDTETLKRTGYATLPERQGDRIMSECGFGGPAEDYAVDVELKDEYHHKVGQAHYLQAAMDEHEPQLETVIASVTNAWISKGSVSPPGKNQNMPASPWEGPFPNLLPKHKRPEGVSEKWKGTPFRRSKGGD